MFRTSSVHRQERFVQAVFTDLVCGNTGTAGHVQPLLQHFVYLVGLHIYYKMIHGPYNIKLNVEVFRSCVTDCYLMKKDDFPCK